MLLMEIQVYPTPRQTSQKMFGLD